MCWWATRQTATVSGTCHATQPYFSSDLQKHLSMRSAFGSLSISSIAAPSGGKARPYIASTSDNSFRTSRDAPTPGEDTRSGLYDHSSVDRRPSADRQSQTQLEDLLAISQDTRGIESRAQDRTDHPLPYMSEPATRNLISTGPTAQMEQLHTTPVSGPITRTHEDLPDVPLTGSDRDMRAQDHWQNEQDEQGNELSASQRVADCILSDHEHGVPPDDWQEDDAHWPAEHPDPMGHVESLADNHSLDGWSTPSSSSCGDRGLHDGSALPQDRPADIVPETVDYLLQFAVTYGSSHLSTSISSDATLTVPTSTLTSSNATPAACGDDTQHSTMLASPSCGHESAIRSLAPTLFGDKIYLTRDRLPADFVIPVLVVPAVILPPEMISLYPSRRLFRFAGVFCAIYGYGLGYEVSIVSRPRLYSAIHADTRAPARHAATSGQILKKYSPSRATRLTFSPDYAHSALWTRTSG